MCHTRLNALLISQNTARTSLLLSILGPLFFLINDTVRNVFVHKYVVLDCIDS